MNPTQGLRGQANNINHDTDITTESGPRSRRDSGLKDKKQSGEFSSEKGCCCEEKNKVFHS
jgi:hypothetical protein